MEKPTTELNRKAEFNGERSVTWSSLLSRGGGMFISRCSSDSSGVGLTR